MFGSSTGLKYVNALIARDGVAVVVMEADDQPYIHTVGNISRNLPEFLMFTPRHLLDQYREAIIDFSYDIRYKTPVPENNTFIKLGRFTFFCYEMDLFHIFQCAGAIQRHYGGITEQMRMIQLLSPDYNGKYPYDADYESRYMFQPLFKCH